MKKGILALFILGAIATPSAFNSNLSNAVKEVKAETLCTDKICIIEDIENNAYTLFDDDNNSRVYLYFYDALNSDVSVSISALKEMCEDRITYRKTALYRVPQYYDSVTNTNKPYANYCIVKTENTLEELDLNNNKTFIRKSEVLELPDNQSYAVKFKGYSATYPKKINFDVNLKCYDTSNFVLNNNQRYHDTGVLLGGEIPKQYGNNDLDAIKITYYNYDSVTPIDGMPKVYAEGDPASSFWAHIDAKEEDAYVTKSFYSDTYYEMPLEYWDSDYPYNNYGTIERMFRMIGWVLLSLIIFYAVIGTILYFVCLVTGSSKVAKFLIIKPSTVKKDNKTNENTGD